MDFLKAIRCGIIHVVSCVGIVLEIIVSFWMLSHIPEMTGFSAISIFFAGLILLIFGIFIIWMLGEEQIDYQELSEKRNREIRWELDTKEKNKQENNLCLESHTES